MIWNFCAKVLVLLLINFTNAQYQFQNAYTPAFIQEGRGRGESQFVYFEEKEEADKRNRGNKTGFIVLGTLVGVLFILVIVALARQRRANSGTTNTINNLETTGELTVIDTPALAIFGRRQFNGLIEIRRVTNIISYTATTMTLQLECNVPESYISSTTRRVLIYGIANATYNGTMFFVVIQANVDSGIIEVARDENTLPPVCSCASFVGALPIIGSIEANGAFNISPAQDALGNITNIGFNFQDGGFLLGLTSAQFAAFQQKAPDAVTTINGINYLNLLTYLLSRN
jgi:hypothetical protein